MKLKWSINIVSLLFLLCVIPGCSKNELIPDLNGSLIGYVYSFDEFSQPLADHGRVTILALGVDDLHFTFSDKNGRFEFKNLPAGTYELRFEKPGFGTLRQFGIKHLGGEPTVLNLNFGNVTTGSAFFLYQLPTTEITYLKIENAMTYCECSFVKPVPEAIGLQIYFSLEDNFDVQSAQFVLQSQRLSKEGGGFRSMQYYGLPFKPGQKVYFRASSSPHNIGWMNLFDHWQVYGISSYFDYETNRMVYPSLGKLSSQYSFIVSE
jgi:hypothetical protein